MPELVEQRRLKRAWAAVQRDPRVREAEELEPDVRKILLLARRSGLSGGFDKADRYDILKYLASQYVGNGARQRTLATSWHYDALIDAVDRLLWANRPDDDDDDYPDDYPDDDDYPWEPRADDVQWILDSRPVLPRKRREDDISYYIAHMEEVEAEYEAQEKSDRAWLAGLQLRGPAQ